MGMVLKFLLSLLLLPIYLCVGIILLFVCGLCWCFAGLCSCIIWIMNAIEFLTKAVASILCYAWSAICSFVHFLNTIICFCTSKICQCLAVGFNVLKFAGKAIIPALSCVWSAIYFSFAFLSAAMDSIAYLILIIAAFVFLVTNPWALALLLFLG